jgi:hypothetical protein
MLDALLSFTKAVCKSCLRIRDRYTPASGWMLGSGRGNPIEATNCLEIIDFKEICKYYKLHWRTATFSSMEGKRYGIVPCPAAIVTSCHSSDEFASAGHVIFLLSNNFTTSTLQIVQIIAIVHVLKPQ